MYLHKEKWKMSRARVMSCFSLHVQPICSFSLHFQPLCYFIQLVSNQCSRLDCWLPTAVYKKNSPVYNRIFLPPSSSSLLPYPATTLGLSKLKSWLISVCLKILNWKMQTQLADDDWWWTLWLESQDWGTIKPYSQRVNKSSNWKETENWCVRKNKDEGPCSS